MSSQSSNTPYGVIYMSELTAKMRLNPALMNIIYRNNAETRKIVETNLKGFIDCRRQILIEKDKEIETARKRCAEASQQVGYNQPPSRRGKGFQKRSAEALARREPLTRDQWKSVLENKYNDANQIFRGGYTNPAITDHRVATQRIREEDKKMQEYFAASEAIEPLVKELKLLEKKLTHEVFAERRRLYTIEYEKLEWVLQNL
jgi:hypothetical protein